MADDGSYGTIEYAANSATYGGARIMVVAARALRSLVNFFTAKRV